jgi:hypothetical protein
VKISQVDLDDAPEVKTVEVDGVPYIKIMGLVGEPVLDLTCVDALNLAMALIEHGGSGLSKRMPKPVKG